MACRHFFGFGAGLLWLLGCGTHDTLPLDLNRLGVTVPNDVAVNGLNLNGLNLNAPGSQALVPQLDLANVSFSSLSHPAGAISTAGLVNDTLVGKLGDHLLQGADLIGARLEGRLTNGMAIPLRIDDVQMGTQGVRLYSIAIVSDTGPVALCGLNNGVPVPAIVLAGYWDQSATHVEDASSFTFGCINAAIGKCALWGYKPWATADECRNQQCKPRPLSVWHHACVRLVRADYCGDGIPHTRSGTMIDVYDQLSIQQSGNADWALEAEWGQKGASCINHTRWLLATPVLGETDLQYVQRVCKDRLSSENHQKCDPKRTTFNTQFGYNRRLDDRPLIRNGSPQYE